MLLKDLQEVNQLDGQIINLQNQLVDLYRKRASFVTPQDSSVTHEKHEKTSVKAEYDSLKHTWATLGVEIPNFSDLRSRLSKAQKLISELVIADPRLNNNLSVILVPPTKMLAGSNISALRNNQRFIKRDDYINSDIAFPAGTSWHVLVAYTASTGLRMGTAQHILASKTYKLAGHDMRGLGVREYTAMSLQLQKPLDASGWTILLKNAKNGIVPSVSFIDGQYRFEYDEVDGLLVEDHFRPAIEVKAGK